MIAILLGLISPLVIGFCLVRILAPHIGSALQTSLGAGAGAGIASFCYFAGLVTSFPALLFEGMAIAAVCTLCFRRRSYFQLPPGPWTTEAKLLAGIFAMSSAAALAAFYSLVNKSPQGGWDGWVIWNTHAHFLANAAWRDAFSPLISYTHSDYPLLLPAFIARTWKITGSGEFRAPQLAAALFTFGTVGVLVSSLATLRNRAYGLAAGILLLSVHYFVVQGAAEYADVPVSFFVLSTLVALALMNRRNENGAQLLSQPLLPVLTGIVAGLAAWTKNDGWMLVVALAAVGIFSLRSAQSRGQYGSRFLKVAGGLAPVLAVVLYFKYAFATANDYISARSQHELAALIFNPARYRTLGLAAWRVVTGPAADYPFVALTGLILLAILVRAFVRLDAGRDRVTVSACAAILAIILAGYCATLIISPFEIGWQVRTAFNRLLLQLLPAAIFTLFMALRLSE